MIQRLTILHILSGKLTGNSSMLRTSFATGVFITLFTCLAHAQGEATATVTPQKIFIDETATYEVNIAGTRQMNSFQPPQVDGLDYVSQSQSSNMSIINGQMSANVKLSFGVRASETGKFTIPSYKIGSITVPAATLEVLPMSEERQQMLDEREQRQREAQREMIGMEIRLAEGPYYAGQAVRMQVVVYARSDLYAEPTNFPVKEGDAFTLSEFGERPDERNANRKGRRYREYIWHNVLTPVKAGSFPLKFTEQFVIGRSFFNRQQLELSSDDLTIDVLPLPQDGKPANFSGAIGNFSIQRPTLDTDQVQVGEPVTMSVIVKGQGNFDRMGPPTMSQNDGWRSYSPESSFRASDTFGTEGEMTYQYVLIPRDESVTETPRVNFSFFEPKAGEYVELSPPGLPIKVTPAPPGSRPTFEPKRNDEQSRRPGLLPIMNQPGSTAAISPVFLNPIFLIGQCVPLLAIIGLFIYRKKQLRLLNDPVYARHLRAKREVARRIGAASAAAGKNDPILYFEEAQRAIQESVGKHLEREPESLSLEEVESFLKEHGADETAIQTARASYEAGDALRFGGLSTSNVDLKQELTQLKAALELIEGGK
ncbi:BatD family protein [Rubellicoccus peritrichatus]|uniref:BatD family protein n=1 Tax=Rubellicoccus peritrichatus TaxID=3080537 RepID=A0AAQ3LAU0_9BACT|nr:BatD family protein [Puniceicoccus sp. CR14]WOO42291.1 BatD family protein [Puniceicoccus sp. CR14]